LSWSKRSLNCLETGYGRVSEASLRIRRKMDKAHRMLTKSRMLELRGKRLLL
jgi:hypothetical protein